jgi:hypothetical protein
MSNTMQPQSMQPEVAGKDLDGTPSRRVFGKNRSNIFSKSFEQNSSGCDWSV